MVLRGQTTAADSVDRVCAVKILACTAQARVEASIGSSLPPHPNLCRLFSLDESPRINRLYLVMELAPGQSLVQWLDAAGRGLPLDEVRHIARALCSALSHLHSHGVAHRDVKCDNVIYDRGASGAVKLCDLGFAVQRPAAASAAELPFLVDDFPGTLAYAPPELVRGNAAYDPCRSDVWSLGVTVFVALTATLPFGSGSNRQATRAAILAATAVSPAPPHHVSPDLARFLQLTVIAAPHERATLDTLLALLSTADNEDAPPPLMVLPRSRGRFCSAVRRTWLLTRRAITRNVPAGERDDDPTTTAEVAPRVHNPPATGGHDLTTTCGAHSLDTTQAAATRAVSSSTSSTSLTSSSQHSLSLRAGSAVTDLCLSSQVSSDIDRDGDLYRARRRVVQAPPSERPCSERRVG